MFAMAAFAATLFNSSSGQQTSGFDSNAISNPENWGWAQCICKPPGVHSLPDFFNWEDGDQMTGEWCFCVSKWSSGKNHGLAHDSKSKHSGPADHVETLVANVQSHALWAISSTLIGSLGIGFGFISGLCFTAMRRSRRVITNQPSSSGQLLQDRHGDRFEFWPLFGATNLPLWFRFRDLTPDENVEWARSRNRRFSNTGWVRACLRNTTRFTTPNFDEDGSDSFPSDGSSAGGRDDHAAADRGSSDSAEIVLPLLGGRHADVEFGERQPGEEALGAGQWLDWGLGQMEVAPGSAQDVVAAQFKDDVGGDAGADFNDDVGMMVAPKVDDDDCKSA